MANRFSLGVDLPENCYALANGMVYSPEAEGVLCAIICPRILTLDPCGPDHAHLGTVGHLKVSTTRGQTLHKFEFRSFSGSQYTS